MIQKNTVAFFRWKRKELVRIRNGSAKNSNGFFEIKRFTLYVRERFEGRGRVGARRRRRLLLQHLRALQRQQHLQVGALAAAAAAVSAHDSDLLQGPEKKTRKISLVCNPST